MKNGTMYAARLKKAYRALRQSLPKPEIPEPDDPVNRLGLALLGVNCTDAEAQRRAERLFSVMVDWNEVRVSSALEVSAAVGLSPAEGLELCQRLTQALHSVFRRENRLSLDRLRPLGRREARQCLEQLPGVNEYAVASVVLWSLGGHAIPVNDPLFEALRSAELVNPTASRDEVQAFLERHVSANQAKEFCILMRSLGQKMPAGGKSKAAASESKRSTKAAKPST